ncbi:hypothetical protein L2E82_44895 [Cichorium intybus]|uniref:Uncharacterized protein n=1 Tax=Cichorium intybus TaxID=13427 RepID=A0ACB8ZRL1_CICIN|nr:hypothetical protein L2E82_44895 [Cichorium intybus]
MCRLYLGLLAVTGEENEDVVEGVMVGRELWWVAMKGGKVAVVGSPSSGRPNTSDSGDQEQDIERKSNDGEECVTEGDDMCRLYLGLLAVTGEENEDVVEGGDWCLIVVVHGDGGMVGFGFQHRVDVVEERVSRWSAVLDGGG